MSLSSMPLEMNYHIVSFIKPDKITESEIKAAARNFVNLSRSCKYSKFVCSEKLQNLKRIYDLVIKYSRYILKKIQNLAKRQ
jgi:hypothetical protein